MKRAGRATGRAVTGRDESDRATGDGPADGFELPTLKPLRVLVAGEVILDRYIMGDVSRVSPEAPIPILQVSRIEERPGNAGFVMANLRALGARVSALSVVGADRNGELLREMFGDLGIERAPCWSTPIARQSSRNGCSARCNRPTAPRSSYCASTRKRRIHSARPRSGRSRAISSANSHASTACSSRTSTRACSRRGFCAG